MNRKKKRATRRFKRLTKGFRKQRSARRKKFSGKGNRKAITDPRVARALGTMRRDGVSASEAARQKE